MLSTLVACVSPNENPHYEVWFPRTKEMKSLGAVQLIFPIFLRAAMAKNIRWRLKSPLSPRKVSKNPTLIALIIIKWLWEDLPFIMVSKVNSLFWCALISREFFSTFSISCEISDFDWFFYLLNYFFDILPFHEKKSCFRTLEICQIEMWLLWKMSF